MVVSSKHTRGLDRQCLIQLEETLIDLDLVVDVDEAIERLKLTAACCDQTARQLVDVMRRLAA